MFLPVAATIAVATPSALPAAIKRAKPGDVIQLASGNYGAVVLDDAQVTITSADPNRRALISRITLNNVRNTTLSELEFSHVPAPGEGNGQAAIRINNGSNIKLDNLYVHGVIDGQVAGDANGISAINVDGLTVTNSRFLEVNAGISVVGSRRVWIDHNDIGFIGSDAIEIPGANTVTISWNKIHDFRTNPGIHPDGIQCWTTRQPSGCKNVRIFRNEITGSPGHEPQGIFFGDEDRVGGYENIEITGNRFVCTMWHAINLYGGPRNVVIRFNRVIAGPNFIPWIRVDAPAKLEGNSAPAYFIVNMKMPILPPGNAIGGRLGQ